MDNNEYARNRRAYLKSRGRCVRCGQVDDRTAAGRIECRRCAEKRKVWADGANIRKMDRYHERKAAGLCPVCGGERDRETVSCSRCLEKLKAAKIRRGK